MDKKVFLFKLGLILSPGALASSSVSEAVWIAVASAACLAILHGFVFLIPKPVARADWNKRPLAARMDRPKPLSGLERESLVVLAIAMLTAAFDFAAKTYGRILGMPAGIFAPVVLANTLLVLAEETLRSKARTILWFCFALFAITLLKTALAFPASASPLFVFLGVGFFLFALGIFLNKEWCLL